MIGPRVFVRTPSRLHFGLLGWGLESGRQFGGLGLMIDRPALALRAERGASMTVRGPLADRVARILEALRGPLAGRGVEVPPLTIEAVEAPPEHAGLGVGTQLSLAVAAAVLRLSGIPLPPAADLARLTGRGQRSGIGLHGFQGGGLIVDGGRKADGDVPPMIARLDFPEEWAVLVILPPGGRGLHGAEEVRAFERLPAIDERTTERLCRIVLLEILPSVIERDLNGFGAALEDLQAQVGASFAPAQGGCYSAPRAPAIIDELHRYGFAGCGQSSWGPALYGFTDRPRDDVRNLAERLRNRLELDPSSLVVARADNRGASIQDA